MDLGLQDRTVIVTGASGGIGRHIAQGFADEGAHVVVTFRHSRDGAEQLAKEIGDTALVAHFDLHAPESGQALVAAALEWTGRIDVLINNAVDWGNTDPGLDAPFEAAPDDEWVSTLRGNTEGAVRLSRAVAPVMRQRRWGRMVHVSSSIATDGMAGGEYYGAAKSALHGFSRSAAFSLGGDGDILSNVVMPGFTRTETNAEMAEAYGDQFAATAPIGRLLDAAEVASPIVYLGSAANTGITGQAITVTGGS